MKKIAELENKLGVTSQNKDLLTEAVTHRSYINENPTWEIPHNERMEFLGDAVLELITTEYLYNNYPNPEGDLTNWRAALVNANMLSKIGAKFELSDSILLSHGEAKDKGRARQYIMANAMEAVIGAIYLDKGYETTKKFVEKHILTELPEIIEKKLYRDHKSLLQELSQDSMGITPTYEVLDEWGPDHDKHFKIGVYLDKELVGTGEGPSKQEAQQEAAHDALVKNPTFKEKFDSNGSLD